MGRAAIACFIAMVATAQVIVGVRAGLVTYIEGAATIESTRKGHGRYWQVKDGETLKTHAGQVELQISAGAVIRLAANSEFQMISGLLEDTQAVLRQGAAIIEVTRTITGSRLQLRVGECRVEPRAAGVYRFDVMPASLRVYGGEASVQCGVAPARLKRGWRMQLASGATAAEFDRNKDSDPFLNWSAERSFRLFRASGENRRKQNQWQPRWEGKYWNEAYSREKP